MHNHMQNWNLTLEKLFASITKFQETFIIQGMTPVIHA